MGGDLGNAFDGLAYMFVAEACMLPLGVWKLVEIIIWLFHHMHIHFS